jgi:hypothetical protein
MFVGKAKSLPNSGMLLHSCRLRPYSQNWTRLERLVRDKDSSLLRILTNCWRKKFYNTGPGLFGADVCRKNARRRNFGKNRFFLKKIVKPLTTERSVALVIKLFRRNYVTICVSSVKIIS